MTEIVDRIRSVLGYDPDTGRLTWLISLSNRSPAGSTAGSDTNGYKEVSVDGVSYRATVIIWAVAFGRLPTALIDHRDGDRSNNRLSNLREATFLQNARNVRMHCDNSAGLKGVSLNPSLGRKKRWVARICVSGRNKNLGYFLTKEEAHAAYVSAANEIFGEFSRAA